jgi:NAD(P)-dependent dehydrogenase (short-subunit alcohol dehydrogenase family)
MFAGKSSGRNCAAAESRRLGLQCRAWLLWIGLSAAQLENEEQMQIDNTTAAVVTGGASGLGKASAEALAAAGVRVAIFDVNEEGGEAVAKALGGLFCKVDITSEESVAAGYAKARAAHGQERILVHCAMTSRRGKTLAWDKEAGKLKRLSTVDYEYGVQGILVASYRLASLAAEGMAGLDPLEDGERGCITLTASVAAQDGQIGQITYGSAKAGVNGLVLPMARDLSDLGIRVNAIMPGIFATPLMLGAKPQVLDSLAASVPFPKRLGKPEEFGSLVMELVRNGYFNGQAIRLDGAIRMAPR